MLSLLICKAPGSKLDLFYKLTEFNPLVSKANPDEDLSSLCEFSGLRAYFSVLSVPTASCSSPVVNFSLSDLSKLSDAASSLYLVLEFILPVLQSLSDSFAWMWMIFT